MAAIFWVFVALHCTAVIRSCAGSKEEEKCPTECPKLPVEPVCDNKGRLYTNRCNLLRIACKSNDTITEVDWLDCEFSECADVACYNARDPVCGSDQRMYENDCYLLMSSCGKTVPVTSSNDKCDSSKR